MPVANLPEISDAKLKLLKTKMVEVLGKGRAAWCIGCGAGPKGIRDLVSNPELFRDTISGEGILASLSRVDIDPIKSTTDWCIGCGAAASIRPELGMPGPEIDKTLEEIVSILRK